MITLILPLVLALSGCSNSYEVVAVMHDGQIGFTLDPKSGEQTACVRRIVIIAEDQRDPNWLENVLYDDDCANKFPLTYGVRLKGRHHQDNDTEFAAKPLQRGVIYQISTTTGATGYGGGRFVIHANGLLENLPYPGDGPTSRS